MSSRKRKDWALAFAALGFLSASVGTYLIAGHDFLLVGLFGDIGLVLAGILIGRQQ